MSRGHGALQQRILGMLPPTVTVPVNVLQWNLAGFKCDLSDAFANSFGRAMKALVADGAVRIDERSLTSYREVVDVFPFRARAIEIVRMRQRLLPVLANFAPDRGVYGRADNEHYVLERVNKLSWSADARWGKIERRWEVLEAALYDLLAKRGAPCRLIVDVITRGRDLFTEVSRISHSAPLGPMLKKLRGAYRGRPAPAVLEELFEFFEHHVPSSERIAASLFSKVLGVVNVQSRGTDTIRDEAAQFLLEAAPRVIRRLPGHRDPANPRGRRGPHAFGQATRFSPMLDKVLTKEILQDFRFVTISG